MTARHAALAAAIGAELPPGTEVEVTRWEGCDEAWGDPVYCAAVAPGGRPLYDAVLDLDAAPLAQQARFAAWQLTHG